LYQLKQYADNNNDNNRTSQMALDAFDLLDHFEWKEKLHLVGISMGGNMAWRY
jgi:pimeloyl-ACP methyl ester carboxylesterase